MVSTLPNAFEIRNFCGDDMGPAQVRTSKLIHRAGEFDTTLTSPTKLVLLGLTGWCSGHGNLKMLPIVLLTLLMSERKWLCDIATYRRKGVDDSET